MLRTGRQELMPHDAKTGPVGQFTVVAAAAAAAAAADIAVVLHITASPQHASNMLRTPLTPPAPFIWGHVVTVFRLLFKLIRVHFN